MSKFIPAFFAGWFATVAFRCAADARPWPAVICGIGSGLLCAISIYRIVAPLCIGRQS